MYGNAVIENRGCKTEGLFTKFPKDHLWVAQKSLFGRAEDSGWRVSLEKARDVWGGVHSMECFVRDEQGFEINIMFNWQPVKLLQIGSNVV